MSNEPGNSSINPMVTRLEGDAPEIEVSLDILKRGIYVAPVIIGVCAVFAGMDGAISALYGMVIVLVNFLLAAGLVAFTVACVLTVLGAGLLSLAPTPGSVFKSTPPGKPAALYKSPVSGFLLKFDNVPSSVYMLIPRESPFVACV